MTGAARAIDQHQTAAGGVPPGGGDAIQIIIKAAMKLVASVEFDVNGTMGKGGNGGLTSCETIHAAGLLRLEISRFQQPRTPAGSAKPEGQDHDTND